MTLTDTETGPQQGPRKDSQLMMLIAQGDKAAMSEFVSRYLDRVLAFARRYVEHKQDAEDVVQEAFIRVWAKAGQWQQRQGQLIQGNEADIPAHSWLYRITYNLCIDAIRKRKKTNSLVLDEEPVSSVTPEHDLGRRQKQKKLDLALNQLPERQCTALMLCHYQGLSNRDAAGIMDISIEALESLLSRARRKLRETLLPTQGSEQ